jgi:hypothetical protein
MPETIEAIRAAWAAIAVNRISRGAWPPGKVSCRCGANGFPFRGLYARSSKLARRRCPVDGSETEGGRVLARATRSAVHADDQERAPGPRSLRHHLRSIANPKSVESATRQAGRWHSTTASPSRDSGPLWPAGGRELRQAKHFFRVQPYCVRPEVGLGSDARPKGPRPKIYSPFYNEIRVAVSHLAIVPIGERGPEATAKWCGATST